MKAFKKLFGKSDQPVGAKEVPVLETDVEQKRGIGEIEPIYVKSMELQSLVDVQEVGEELRVGNIVVLDIASFMSRDPEELKRAIDQLKGICQGIGGDVGRLTESKILATPRYVTIQFKKAVT